MELTATIDLLPLRARKQVLKGLVGQLNQSIIGYARAHLRQLQFADPDELPTIDLYNEMRARETDAALKAQAISDMGFVAPEAPIVQCMRFTILRDWLELEIAHTNEGVAFDPQWDAPFSIENSLDWNIQKAPRFDEAEIKKLAEACGRSFDQLRAANMKAANDDRLDLEANRDAILDVYTTCSQANLATRSYTVRTTVVDDGEERVIERVVDIDPITQREGIEILIGELPLQAQWRLAIKLHDLMIDAGDRAVNQLLRKGGRGSRDAAADIRLIDAARAAHYRQLKAFDKQHGHALDDIADRGLFVAELPDPVEEPIVVSMDAQRAREDDIKLGGAGKLAPDAAADTLLGNPSAKVWRRAPEPDDPSETRLQAALKQFDSERPLPNGEA